MGRMYFKNCFVAVVFCILCVIPVVSSNTDSTYSMFHTNSCEDSGKALSCDEGHVIKISDVRCMPYNYTCSEKDKISRLCDGLRICSRIDLRRQLHYYCKNYPAQEVVTSFQCVRETTKPICRTNVCSEESRDLRCRRGKFLHILSATCNHGLRHCSADVYLVLFRSCEGQRSCLMESLRHEFPAATCNSSFVQQQNVFLDYICVDRSLLSDRCTGSFVTLSPLFGILASPGYPYNPNGINNGCYWVIYPPAGHEVDVHVHLAYSKEGREDCNSRFLQVQYTLCDTRDQRTDRFCDEGRVNAHLHSCGTVYIMHWPYKPGEENGNRFLVSYHVKEPSSQIEAYEPYTYQCERPEDEAKDARYTLVYGETTTYVTTETPFSTETETNDQPLSDGSISPSDVQASKKPSNVKKSDPWKMVTLLRVVVVNIFLGLLIIALIMALVFICYRYRTYGREKKNKKNMGSGSNTATTLDGDKNSTEMQLLPEDRSPYSETSPDKHSDSIAVEQGYIQKNATYQTVPQNDSRECSDHVYYNTKTGVSTFLPKQGGNKDYIYSSLEPAPNGVVENDTRLYANSNSTSPKKNCDTGGASRTRELSPNHEDAHKRIRDSLQQYKIGDDGYAVVVKSQIKSPAAASNNHSGSLKRGEKGGHGKAHARKPVAHVCPVPDEEHCKSSSKTTMHMIPKHDCLLQRCPPPPPPPPPKSAMGINEGYWGSPERDLHRGHHSQGQGQGHSFY